MPGRLSCLRRMARRRRRMKPSMTRNKARRGMLEVTKPSPKHRVEIADDPLETVASAPDRSRPHLVLERLQALLANQPEPALGPAKGRTRGARLEPIAEELEPLPRLSAVTNPRLVRVKGQTVLRYPRLNLAQGGLGPRLPFGTGSQSHRRIAPCATRSAPSAGRAGADRGWRPAD